MAVELRLLGPVEIHAGGEMLAVGGPQRRVLLAAVAVDAGRMVPRQQLIDRVWDTAPPAGVDSAVYAHVARLRAVLGQVNAVENPATPAALDRRTGGYLLRVAPDVVDLHRFRRLVAEAGGAGRPAAARLPSLREALGLWR